MSILPSLRKTDDRLPAHRMSALLRSARLAAGMTVEQAAERAACLSVHELQRLEAGTKTVSREVLTVLAAVYGHDPVRLVPARLQLEMRPLPELRRTSDWDFATTDTEVLLRYLAVVHYVRRIEPGRRIELRMDDLVALGAFLERTPDDVRAALSILMVKSRQAIAQLHFAVRTQPDERRVNLTVATTPRGALILTRRPSPRPGSSLVLSGTGSPA